MVKHSWSTTTDFSYCELENVTLDESTGIITLDSDQLSGTIITDIKDSSNRFSHYGQLIKTTSTPVFTNIEYYYKSSDDPDNIGDWILIDKDITLYENDITLFTDRLVVDYDINILNSILSENIYRDGYNYEGNSLIDYAVVGEAIVGLECGGIDHADDATFSGNVITPSIPFPEAQYNVIVAYSPKHPILQATGRYVQLKIELESTSLGVVPSISDINLDYRLTNVKAIDRICPMFYKRL
jgi:hypothetical protein